MKNQVDFMYRLSPILSTKAKSYLLKLKKIEDIDGFMESVRIGVVRDISKYQNIITEFNATNNAGSQAGDETVKKGAVSADRPQQSNNRPQQPKEGGMPGGATDDVGMTLDHLKEKLLAKTKTELDNQVSQGKLTAEQAQDMISRITEYGFEQSRCGAGDG